MSRKVRKVQSMAHFPNYTWKQHQISRWVGQTRPQSAEVKDKTGTASSTAVSTSSSHKDLSDASDLHIVFVIWRVYTERNISDVKKKLKDSWRKGSQSLYKHFTGIKPQQDNLYQFRFGTQMVSSHFVSPWSWKFIRKHNKRSTNGQLIKSVLTFFDMQERYDNLDLDLDCEGGGVAVSIWQLTELTEFRFRSFLFDSLINLLSIYINHKLPTQTKYTPY